MHWATDADEEEEQLRLPSAMGSEQRRPTC